MTEISEEHIAAVLKQIAESDKPLNAGDLEGDEEQNLLAVRALKLRGDITGKFLDCHRRPGDQSGRFLAAAARLSIA